MLSNEQNLDSVFKCTSFLRKTDLRSFITLTPGVGVRERGGRRQSTVQDHLRGAAGETPREVRAHRPRQSRSGT